MIREEVIDFLECRRAYYASLSTDPSPHVKATKVCGYTLAESANACLIAIKALEQDCISRTDMLDAIGHGTTYTSEDLQRIVKELPSANIEYGVEMSGIPTGSESDQNDDIEAMLEHLWNATEEDHRRYSEVEVCGSNFIQLKQDVLNNKQLWRKLREIEDEDSD